MGVKQAAKLVSLPATKTRCWEKGEVLRLLNASQCQHTSKSSLPEECGVLGLHLFPFVLGVAAL